MINFRPQRLAGKRAVARHVKQRRPGSSWGKMRPPDLFTVEDGCHPRL